MKNTSKNFEARINNNQENRKSFQQKTFLVKNRKIRKLGILIENKKFSTSFLKLFLFLKEKRQNRKNRK